VEDEKHYAYDEHEMKESGGNVKCEKSKKPKNDQNCSD
jgi:hypothetical protein